MTTKGFAEDSTLRESLRKPFPKDQIGKLPKGGTQLSYVGHGAVTHRLLEVAPDWTWTLDHVERFEKDGKPHVAGIIGTMTIAGKSITEAGDPDQVSSFGAELKLAISDFIRRGAMRFGVALDLWSKEDLHAEVKDSAPPPKAAAEAGPDPGTGTGPAPSQNGSNGKVSPELWREATRVYGSLGAVQKAYEGHFGVKASAEEVTPEQIQELIGLKA